MAVSVQADLLPAEFTPAEPVPPSRKKTDPEELFASQCRAYRLPAFETQHLFAKAIGRKWRFDVAFVEYKLAVEIEGLVVMRVWAAKLIGPAPIAANGRVVNVSEVKPTTVTMGRHATITGMREDCDKYNSAALLGWTVLRFEQKAIKPLDAINMTQRVLAAKGWRGPQT
jgi:hypothetical protein